MNYSIRKKMFLISMSTTLLSFLMVLLCFNLISDYHIKKESTQQLNQAATMAYSMAVSPSTATHLEKEFQEGNQAKDVKLIITDKRKESLIYPQLPTEIAEVSSTAIRIPVQSNGSTVAVAEMQAIQSFALDHPIPQPTRADVNGTNYYLLEAQVGDGTTAVFYKNVQSLEDLAADFNLALLLLLVFFGMVTIGVTMGLTNGMVCSIRRLCSFANDIGAGKLQNQVLGLKEKELAVLEKDMNEMATRLAAYDVDQKTFFQNVSHQLRTPLMSIQGYAEGITSHVFEEEEVEDAAGIILTESDRLASLVDDLLCLSRADSGKPWGKVEIFNAMEALQDVMAQVKCIAREKEIDFSPQNGEILVTGNRQEFQHALLNILTNALRYANSQVRVVASCEEKTIHIIDDGPGIEEKDLPHIFKRFYKGKDGQSGIGLSIARTVIEGCNGKITAENQDGAIFTILLS